MSASCRCSSRLTGFFVFLKAIGRVLLRMGASWRLPLPFSRCRCFTGEISSPCKCVCFLCVDLQSSCYPYLYLSTHLHTHTHTHRHRHRHRHTDTHTHTQIYVHTTPAHTDTHLVLVLMLMVRVLRYIPSMHAYVLQILHCTYVCII